MSKYVKFEYKKLVADYLAVYPNERSFFTGLAFWSHVFKPPQNIIIAGGFVMKLYQLMPFGESDIDIFSIADASMRDLLGALRGAAFVTKKTSLYAATFDLKLGYDVQIIKQKFGNTFEKIANSFDLTNCKCYTDLTTVWIHEKAIDCLAKNKLKDGSPYSPYVNMDRIKKYIQLGFIPAGVLKRKIHEARSIAMEELLLEEEDTIVSEANAAPVVLNLRHAQQLPPDVVHAQPANPDAAYIGGAVEGGIGNYAAVQDWAAVGAVAQIQQGAYAGYWEAPPPLYPPMPEATQAPSQRYSQEDYAYASGHNLGVYLPKYAKWLEREAYRAALKKIIIEVPNL